MQADGPVETAILLGSPGTFARQDGYHGAPHIGRLIGVSEREKLLERHQHLPSAGPIPRGRASIGLLAEDTDLVAARRIDLDLEVSKFLDQLVARQVRKV